MDINKNYYYLLRITPDNDFSNEDKFIYLAFFCPSLANAIPDKKGREVGLGRF